MESVERTQMIREDIDAFIDAVRSERIESGLVS